MSSNMTIEYNYRITYPNGKGYSSEKTGNIAVCELSSAEYAEFAKYTAAGSDLNAPNLSAAVSAVVTRMKERIAENDLIYSTNGRLLAKRLKKSREIKNIEAWIEEYDLARFEQMGDIDAVLARPEQ